MNTKEILQYLENLEVDSALQVNGNTYTWEQVKLAQKINSDTKKELGFLPSKPKLSRRRAFIVILEELYYDVPDYPKEVTLALKKVNYRRALSHLVQFQSLFFEVEKAVDSLKDTYRDILLC